MSSSSSTDPLTYSSAVALPTTTTFLPVLDDLLSPDFRPVALPPVTPLQTPTTANSSSGTGATNTNQVQPSVNGNHDVNIDDHAEAAAKIQKWWKKRNEQVQEVEGEETSTEADLKHKIRHKRTEEYIRHLESEVTRLKHSLTAERKLRSLQFEAIRSLWSQVQKITANNVAGGASSLMTQSMPNGLLQENLKPPSPPQQQPVQPCTCTTEITNLKQKLEQEMSDLRKLVSQLLIQKESATTVSENPESKVNKRPDTLDLGGNGVKHGELQGYADNIARSVVQQAGVCGENSNEADGASKEA